MKTLTIITITTVFWLAAIAIVAGAFVAGSYQAGNVINIVTVPRDMEVYAASPADMRDIEAAANSFPFVANTRK